jgi:PAS domain S-box-containing protein/diguanylate cyclase (GGDEF)-like protein
MDHDYPDTFELYIKMNSLTLPPGSNLYQVLLLQNKGVNSAEIRAQLASCGLKINLVEVSDKSSFLVTIQKSYWDLLVLDECGADVADFIPALAATSASIPGILISTKQNTPDSSVLQKAGIREVIAPQDCEQLAALVRRVLCTIQLEREHAVTLETLRDQRAYLDVLVSSLKAAVIVIAEDGKILSWSQSATVIFGYQPDQILEKQIQDYLLKEVASDDQAYQLKHLNFAQLKELAPGSAEVTMRDQSGAVVYADLTIQPLVMDREPRFSLVVRNIEWVLKDREKAKLLVEVTSVRELIRIIAAESTSLGELSHRILKCITQLSFLKSLGAASLVVTLPDQTAQVFNYHNGVLESINCAVASGCAFRNFEAPLEARVLSLPPECASGCLQGVDARCGVIPLNLDDRSNENIGYVIVWLRRAPFQGYERRSLESVGRTIAAVMTSFEENRVVQKLISAIEESPVATVITNNKGIIEYANHCAIASTGYQKEELIGQHTRIFQSGLTPQAVYQDLWSTISEGRRWRGELQNKNKKGELYWEKVVIFPIISSSGEITNFVAIKQDVTERKRQSEQIDFMSTHDSVTGLPNHVLMFDRLGQLIDSRTEAKSAFTIVLLNIVHFHQFNESLGYTRSNMLMRQIANTLAEALLPEESIARAHGAAFYLLLSQCGTEESAEARFNQIIQSFTNKIVFEGEQVKVNFNAGAALYPVHGKTPEQLLAMLDEAHIQAKVTGGALSLCFLNAVAVSQSMSRFNFRSEIERALQEQEFELHFQPQVSSENAGISGCEALIRWHHPVKGFISPMEFIPIAEESDLIQSVGNWVLESAFTHLALWKEAVPKNFRMAINLSAKQLISKDLLPYIESLIKTHGINPKMLEFEITESAIVGNLEECIGLLSQLRSMGCAISIDDFGTGYSNLGYLKQFPLDRLKIDRCFVKEITHSAEDALLSKLIVQISQTLGLQVVAEGVETEAQYHLLRRLNCDYLQGYYFSKPVPANEFLAILKSPAWNEVETPVAGQDTLLIVDDEQAVISSLTRLFRRSKYKLLSTTSPKDALEILAVQPVGVLVCDQRMPEMSGTELLRRVKKMYPDTVRIMLSGYAEIDAVTKAVNEGAIYKFFLKPWSDEELVAEVHSAFQYYHEKLAKSKVRPPL